MGYYIQTMKAHPDPTWSYGAYLELWEFLMTSGKENQSLKIPVKEVPLDSPYQPPKPPPGQTPPPYTGRGPTTRRQKVASVDRVSGTPKSYHSSIPTMVNSQGNPYEPNFEGGYDETGEQPPNPSGVPEPARI